MVGVFNVLKDTTKSTFDFITGFIGGAMDGAAKIIGDYVNAIKRIFGGIVDFVTGVFTGDWSRAWQGVVDIFGGIFEGIAAVAKAPINAMITLINGFIGGLNNIKYLNGCQELAVKDFILKNPLFSRRWNYSKWPSHCW